MKHRFIPPPEHLKKYIRYFWTLEGFDVSRNDNVFKVFARRFPRMVFQHNNGSPAIYSGENFLPLGYLSGLNSLPYNCGIQPTVSTTGVSFYPPAIKLFFGFDVFEMVDLLPDIENFVPRELTQKIIETKEVTERINILVDFFTGKLNSVSRVDRVVERGWQILNKVTDETKIPHLQRYFGISEKQLERRFKASIGLSPKKFLRITRFEKAITRMQHSHDSNLSNIAYDLDYFDQSHFIREFKEFSNLTPTEYLRQQKIFEENSAMMVAGQPK